MSKMMTRQERLLALALRLSPDERAFVADKLWDSLEEESQSAELTEDQKAELDRRIADMEENPGDERPWEQVRAELFRRK